MRSLAYHQDCFCKDTHTRLAIVNQLKKLIITFTKCWDCFQTETTFAESDCADQAIDLLDRSDPS
ncbi:uncharacterized protein METZ01_LOCUS435305 [marine metagenome]|uniref:Uncharacterized protein n=1 Tax=marine metagenome TaxID=408172 RepID=A0A382YHN0_9ZZZZ